jgi:urease accessory protein
MLRHVRMLQIADSALPIGGYTHSWGLETAITARRVMDAPTLEQWTAGWLRHSLAPLEGVVVACSARVAHAGAASEVWALNQLMEVSLLPGSIRRASTEMGLQLLELAETWEWSSRSLAPYMQRPAEAAPWHHSVAFGLLGAIAGAEPEEVVTAYLHQAALGMISAGVRGIPVGHTHGQQVLAYLQGTIGALAVEVSGRDVALAGNGSPWYDIQCEAQTTLYARVFRS